MSHWPSTDKASQQRHRFHALDALRGVAALGVVLTHCLQQSMNVGFLHHSPMRLFVNGRGFVIFFFVLSGFVLAMGLWRGDQQRDFGTYALRRVARIVPPYMAAGILAIALVAATGPVNLSSAWDYFLLAGTSTGIALDPPSWSLVYELRISLLIPLICWFIMRKEAAATLTFVALFLVEEATTVFLKIGQFPYSADTILQAITVTLRFAVCFYAGVWLAKQVLRERAWLKRADDAMLPVLGLAAYLLMTTLLDQFCMVGAVIVILLALRSSKFARLLGHGTLQWLGRVSYSLYLTHFLILTALLQVLPATWPTFERMVLVIAASLAFAEVFHRLIEAPFITLSRAIRGTPARRPVDGVKPANAKHAAAASIAAE